MKKNTVGLWAQAGLWIFYGLLGYMPLHILLSTWLGTSFGVLEFAKVAKDMVLVLGFGLALVASVRQKWFRPLLRDELALLVLAYAVLTIGLALARPTDQDAELLGVVYNLRFLLFASYALLLAHLFDARHLKRAAVKIVLAAGAVVVAFGLVQYFALPSDALTHVGYSKANGVFPAFFIDDKPDLERVMSTLRDPNSLGSYLIIIAPLAAATLLVVKNQRKRNMLRVLVIASTLCLWLTFSRAAWLGFALAVASFLALADNRLKQSLMKRRTIVFGLSAAALVIAAAGLFTFRNTYLVQNIVLHADESTVLEDPNELRVRQSKASVQRILDEPLGRGPGTAGLASIRNQTQGTLLNENYYLQIASEVGVVGLVLFVAILVLVGLRLFGLHASDSLATALLASFIGLALTNLLAHIWSNEAVAYTWWGLTGLWLARTNSHNGLRSK